MVWFVADTHIYIYLIFEIVEIETNLIFKLIDRTMHSAMIKLVYELIIYQTSEKYGRDTMYTK